MSKTPDYSDFMGETEEVGGSGGGDFARTHNFDENDTLVGTFQSTRIVNTRNGEREIHNFTDPDGEPVDAWGTAILNSRLKSVPAGARVKIVKTGKKLPTKNGRQAWEFQVLVAKGSLKSA